ncbi:MAG: hypothetical protein DRN49_03075, partial [Thaumarchaeota archaeon]
MVNGLNIVKVKLKIDSITEDKLKIKDEDLNYIFMFKRNKRTVSFVVGIRGRAIPYKFPLKTINRNILVRCLEKVDDEGIRNNIDSFADQLMEFYEAWEERLEDLELTLEIQKDFEKGPVARVRTSTGEIAILESDGYTIPLHSGLIRLGRRTFAVIETTYALIRKAIQTRKGGIAEIETVAPLMIIAEYSNGELKNIRAEDPEVGVLRIFDRIPVKIEKRSKAASSIPTLLDSETLVKLLNGEINAPDYREVFNEIIEGLKRFVSFEWDVRLYSVVASYILFTYFYDFFTTAPRLFFLGPYGSGKTRAMLTVTYMSRHGFVVLDPSEASSYRSIEAYGPTLGVDESALNDKLLKIIAAGYKKGLRVPRIEASRDSFILTLFDTYSPVVLSFTEIPKEILIQRTIVINMFKTSDPNPERRDPEPHDFEDLRRKIYLLRILKANEFIEAMDRVRGEIKDRFMGREYEVWYPLLVAAYLGGEEHYKNVYEYAEEDLKRRKTSLYSEERLVLAAIKQLLGDKDSTTFTASQLQQYIVGILVNEEGYTENQAKRIWSPTKIGMVLRRIGLRKRSSRTDKGPRYIYEITSGQFLDLAERYGYSEEDEEDQERETCSNRSNCSNLSEKVSGESDEGSDGRGQLELMRKTDTHTPEKVTTVTTVTTKTDQAQVPMKMGVLDAILEVVRRRGRATLMQILVDVQ